MRRHFDGRIPEERVHCRQAQVTRSRGDATSLLLFIEEDHDQRRIDVFQRQCGRRLVQAPLYELQQQPEAIAV
jgi:hypothetical protein